MPLSAHSIELYGSVRDLLFPPLCANCGNAAKETLLVEKVFHPPGPDANIPPVIIGGDVPFCTNCVARHRSEVKIFTPGERFRLCFRSGSMLGTFFYPLLGFFVLYMAARSATRGSIVSEVVAAIGALFVMCAWHCYRRAFDQTRWYAVPPLTSVTSAFDFSAKRGELFDPERRIFTLRNPYFAEAFIGLNQARAWNPQSPAALKAAVARNCAAAVVLVALGIWLVWQFGSSTL